MSSLSLKQNVEGLLGKHRYFSNEMPLIFSFVDYKQLNNNECQTFDLGRVQTPGRWTLCQLQLRQTILSSPTSSIRVQVRTCSLYPVAQPGSKWVPDMSRTMRGVRVHTQMQRRRFWQLAHPKVCREIALPPPLRSILASLRSCHSLVRTSPAATSLLMSTVRSLSFERSSARAVHWNGPCLQSSTHS